MVMNSMTNLLYNNFILATYVFVLFVFTRLSKMVNKNMLFALLITSFKHIFFKILFPPNFWLKPFSLWFTPSTSYLPPPYPLKLPMKSFLVSFIHTTIRDFLDVFDILIYSLSLLTNSF